MREGLSGCLIFIVIGLLIYGVIHFLFQWLDIGQAPPIVGAILAIVFVVWLFSQID